MIKWTRLSTIVQIAIVTFWVFCLLAILQLPRLSFFNPQRTLRIATWPLLIDAQYIQAFEQETGIRVEISYFERSEELFSKLKATDGYGYDIIFPSDYTVALLAEHNLLKPLDKTKLTFWDQLDPRLLDAYYDPNNTYSIPFFWGVYGIGYNKQIYGADPEPTWGILFQEDVQRLVMADNPRETILMTALYLFGSLEPLQTPEGRQKVKKMLIKQKRHVQQYTDERIDDLLSAGNSYIAFGLSTDISRAATLNPSIGFMIPKEGSFLIIDSVAISKGSDRDGLVYSFINFLYQKQVIEHHIALYNMCSPLQSTQVVSDYCPDDKTFAKLQFLKDVVGEQTMNQIWIDLLAR